MIKNITLALIAITGMSAVALPMQAQAASVPSCTASQNSSFDSDTVLLELQSAGHKVTSVEEWNGCVRGYIKNTDGSSSMAYFDPDTLQQLS